MRIYTVIHIPIYIYLYEERKRYTEFSKIIPSEKPIYDSLRYLILANLFDRSKKTTRAA